MKKSLIAAVSVIAIVLSFWFARNAWIDSMKQRVDALVDKSFHCSGFSESCREPLERELNQLHREMQE